MWLKRKGCETINLDLCFGFKPISKLKSGGYDDNQYEIVFYFQTGQTTYSFDFEKERDLYLAEIDRLVRANEVK